jgi:effector-binding domain-containing protein
MMFNFRFSLMMFFVILTTGVNAMAIEKPKYRILESEDDFELRLYEPSIVAETLVEGEFSEVGNEGFRRLAAYINGKNRQKQSISMTAPVTQEAGSEKIAMTAPVSQESTGSSWRISFLMPSKYKMETLPDPIDERIALKTVPARSMAAIRYSGTWSQNRFEEKRSLLLERVQEQGWKTLGEPTWARYDPPFMPWFLRRNEILVAVEKNDT